MVQEKDREVVRGEMLTKEEILKLSKGICPWQHMKAPRRADLQTETDPKDKRVAG